MNRNGYRSIVENFSAMIFGTEQKTSRLFLGHDFKIASAQNSLLNTDKQNSARPIIKKALRVEKSYKTV